jgi:hypothetical protein
MTPFTRIPRGKGRGEGGFMRWFKMFKPNLPRPLFSKEGGVLAPLYQKGGSLPPLYQRGVGGFCFLPYGHGAGLGCGIPEESLPLVPSSAIRFSAVTK